MAMDQNTLTQPSKPTSPFGSVTGLVGFAVGYLFIKVAGIGVVLPWIAALLIWLGLSKVRRPLQMRGAVSIQLAHAVWIGWGLFMTQPIGLPFLEPAAVIVVALWLALTTGRLPAMLLCSYQAMAACLNIYSLAIQGFESKSAIYLGVHLLLRASAITLMVRGLLETARARRAARHPSEAPISQSTAQSSLQPGSPSPPGG
jgi:hypothetical protein